MEPAYGTPTSQDAAQAPPARSVARSVAAAATLLSPKAGNPQGMSVDNPACGPASRLTALGDASHPVLIVPASAHNGARCQIQMAPDGMYRPSNMTAAANATPALRIPPTHAPGKGAKNDFRTGIGTRHHGSRCGPSPRPSPQLPFSSPSFCRARSRT